MTIKKLLSAGLLSVVCLALSAYSQNSTTSSSSAPLTGAYDPHPGESGQNLPPPIEQRPKDFLIRDAKFNLKLQKLFPDFGAPIQACDGFKTLGDCVAAMYVSKNLGIALPDLKAKATVKGSNLEKGIHELKPDVDAKTEKKKAWKQAEKEIPVSN